MASIKIYGLRGSLRTRSVLATLEELALPFEFVSTDFEKMKTQEFLVKQPWGKVPVLEDGSDFQLYESRAIIRYLVNAYDRAGALYPVVPKARAVVDQWISIEQSYYVAAEDLISELIFGPLFGKTANDAKVKDAEVRLAKVLDVMDKHLAKSKFMGGDHFTIADIVYMPDTQLILARLPQYVALYEKHGNVTRWWKEISARASWQKVNSQSEF